MRAMKDSGIEWIGEIPQEWKTARIKHVIDRSEFGIKIGPFGSTLANRTLISGPYNVYSQANLISNSFSDTNHYIDRDTFVDLRSYEVKPGDVCVSMMGTIGKCKVVPEGITEGIMDSHLIKIRLDEAQIDPSFFEYVYDKDNSGVCFTQMQYEKKGTIMDCLNTAIVKNLVIPLPPLSDQINISRYLDTKCAEIDALIAAKEKTNALLKERRQSIIYEAVTKGLDPTAPMKDSGVEWIGGIPEGWQVAPLKYFASIRSGFTLGKKCDSELELREYPYLRVANVQGEYTDLENVTTILMPVTEAEQYKLKAGELLMTEGGDRDKLGRGSIWQGEIPDCLHQNHVFALSADERLSIEYLDYLTASDVGRNYFDYTAVKTTNLASTNATTILNFKIPIPSINEQLNIVEYLKEKCRTIDDVLWINNEAIQKLKEYRQSLIYEAVTGKKEV